MSNSVKPTIAVCGATGAQGGSVVEYLLNDPDHTFRIRGLTRNADSPKAKALAERGVEVVKANLNDIESLKSAFDGAYGVFGLTNFWDPDVMSEEKELKQGKNLIDAAAAVGVKHFVFSTLDHTSDPEVPHWNSKANIDDYLKEKGLPRTSLYTAFYLENHLQLLSLKKGPDGRLVADWPVLLTDGPIGSYSVAETGAYVLEAFKKPKEWIGKDIRVISDVYTPRQLVQSLREILGKEIELVETDQARFNSQKATNYELWANNQWFYKNNGSPNRDPELTLRINPTRKDHRAFIEANKDAFLAALK